MREHVELAYAGTVHAAQGRTLYRSYAVVDDTVTRNMFYVMMTRGEFGNYAFIAKDPVNVADLRTGPEQAEDGPVSGSGSDADCSHGSAPPNDHGTEEHALPYIGVRPRRTTHDRWLGVRVGPCGMDESRVKAYMARIGADLPARPDDGVLHDLHLRHLLTVPFENLSIHLDEDIALDEDALVIKIVDRRRGGFCYELNGAFGALLSALGYDVTPLAARVFDDDGPGIPYDHLALRVGPWLVDVGFGRDTHYYPLRLDDRGDQTDPAGTFRIVDGPEGDLDVLQDGRPVYRLETRPRRLRDFVTGCWWYRTSPDSLFTRSVVCSMPTESGRITLNGRKLIRTADGKRDEQELGDDTTVLAAYRTYFGIELDRVPGVGAS